MYPSQTGAADHDEAALWAAIEYTSDMPLETGAEEQQAQQAERVYGDDD
jgi:hypothetical protein